MKRSTPLKREMLALLEKHHMLSVPQFLSYLEKAGLKVNKTSVYRNLYAFLKEGIVCQQSFGRDEFLYELRRDHHDHLQCESCGKIVETPCAVKIPSSINGFSVGHHHLTVFGLCENCQH